MSQDFGVNQGVVEEQFIKWMSNPSSVDEHWQAYFEKLPSSDWPELTSSGSIAAPGSGQVLGNRPAKDDSLSNISSREVALSPYSIFPQDDEAVSFTDRRKEDRREGFRPSSEVLVANELQGRVSALINAYRVRGHRFANLDPLGLQERPSPDVFLERYGLQDVDKETVFATGDLAGPSHMPLGQIVDQLNETYCRTIGAEYTFLQTSEARRWLQIEMEKTKNHPQLDAQEQKRILTKLTDAEIFEQFLHTKYKGAKRFSLEGGESVIPMLDYMLERAAGMGVTEAVIGMAHRGRLNVLANILEMNLREIFASFEDDHPENHIGGGDVKYHLGYSLDRVVGDNQKIHVTLAFNPSHLEFVNPVVEGRVRAKQDRYGDEEREQVLPILIHGDAAFVGQGIVAETLNLSMLPAYKTGGTIHVVINNQIGFTTIPDDSRSTRYCTDITRMLRCPVFHVNGEDPEAVAQVVRLATEYRQRFHSDVVIDLFCYRKYGHNEGDEPRYTQPLMYKAVDNKRTVREVYIDELVRSGQLTEDQAAAIEEKRRNDLENALKETREGSYDLIPASMGGVWSKYKGGSDLDVPEADTSLSEDQLRFLLDRLTTVREGFTPHPRLKRFVLDKQRKMMETGEGLDWGAAENLAFASLLVDKYRVRLTGQDVRRGTFSHRHAVIYDSKDGERYTRLGHLTDDQAKLEIYDSTLSEAGVLGFEWGYSLDSPDGLVIWEAQFGDFANGAQVIIDQFISSSEDKWNRLSGLVLLLPHGFEGQGPEHSSARLERFLTLCAEDNMQVCNLTTPAQIFHVLRRQVLRPWRKPLVVMTPKSLLRHPRAQSSFKDLSENAFQRIIGDKEISAKKARRVLLCSGKVYYDLLQYREEQKIDDVAIVRIEQLYPLHKKMLRDVLKSYKKGTEVFWVQEEPKNMGALCFLSLRLEGMIGDRFKIDFVSRPESASPATGSKSAHGIEQKELLDKAFSSTN